MGRGRSGYLTIDPQCKYAHFLYTLLGCFIFLFILTLDLCHLSLWPSNLHPFFFFGYDLGYPLLFAPLKKPLYIFCNQTKPILLILIYYYLLYYIMEILWNWRLEWYLIFFSFHFSVEMYLILIVFYIVHPQNVRFYPRPFSRLIFFF